MTVTAHLYHPDFLPACQTGDLETVTKILNHETPQVSTAQLQDGLSNAVWGEHLAVADLLLSKGARVNRMAFLRAIDRGDPAMFEVLIKNGWDVNTTEFEEGTALRLSVENPPLMSFLLSHSADPNLLSIPGRLRRAPSALITAAVVKDGADAIRTLLDHGAVLEPNIIHCAIEASCRWRNIDKEHGCAERVRLLIDAAKETAKGREEGVKWYLNYLDLKKKGTPLHCAVWWQRLETVQVLVGEGADVGVLCRGMTVAQAARRRAEMVGGHESATRIWEWLTGRRWEDGEGIEEMDEEGSTFKDEVEVELETGETVYRSGNIGRPPRLDEESLALTIKLTLSGHLA